MKKIFILFSLFLLTLNVHAQTSETDTDGCPITDGSFDPIPNLPAICYEKYKPKPGPGFPGNANPIVLNEIEITPQNPNHPLNPSNPWYPYITVPVYYPAHNNIPATPCDLMNLLMGKTVI